MHPKLARVAGVTVPLFSLRTRRSWGVGSIGDLEPFAEWIATAGLSLIQLLPIAEGSGASESPYAALSAFGIDPIYIDVDDLPGLSSTEVNTLLSTHDKQALAALRRTDTVDYALVRRLKRQVLHSAWETFTRLEAENPSALGREFQAFSTEHSDWLDELALFVAIKRDQGSAPWWQWPLPLRDRQASALQEAQAALHREIHEQKYLQWIANRQWSAARAALRSRGTQLMGDLPFMVDRDSADVWRHRDQFLLHMSVGVPADQFDEEGQDWGMPPYDWRAMEDDGFQWLQRRCAYAGRLYDRFRVDHLVGFYRTYMRPFAERRDVDGHLCAGVFSPESPAAQLAHGERVLQAMLAGAATQGARLIAEDLGSIPDFVPQSLAGLGVPGYKVLIWEKDPETQSFVDPKTYPARSIACFGTHDTDPVAAWWRGLAATPTERAAVAQLLGLPAQELPEDFTPEIQQKLCVCLLEAGSELVLLLIQDLLGSDARINIPGTQGPHNWTYRLPATIEALKADVEISATMARVQSATQKAGRIPSPEGAIDAEILERLRRGLDLRLDRLGGLWIADEAIEHPRVIAVLRRGFDLHTSGEPTVHLGEQWCYLQIDDCFFRVLSVSLEIRSDTNAPELMLHLDDARTIRLDPASLWEEPERGLRCSVPSFRSGQPLSARFTNRAQLELAEYIDLDASPRPQLVLGEERWTIGEAPPAPT